MKFFRALIFLLLSLCCHQLLSAQPQNYILNGSAVRNTCNCYTLTPASTFQSGSVWNKNKIDLGTSFDFLFSVYLGNSDLGADGMVFILQPISTSVGNSGEGMGFQGIIPSIGIALDTYQNTNLNDPIFDHISIQSNGNNTHGADLAGPVQASATDPNIEDGQFHVLRISWDAVTHTLTSYFDGVQRLQIVNDLIINIFNNDPMVYWGFSAATGGSVNVQQFCTALTPGFKTGLTSDGVCLGTPISFTDQSQSFTTIQSYYWDFGDGSKYYASNPPPHLYAVPGAYDVKMVITGFDGCISDTLHKTVYVGDDPIADFEIHDTCAGLTPRIIDHSQVLVGTIKNWNWTLDGSPVATNPDHYPSLTNLNSGTHQLRLVAVSEFGCTSTTAIKNFVINPQPKIAAQFVDGCIDKPVSFTGLQNDNQTNIIKWSWDFGDGQTSNSQTIQHTYSVTGHYDIQLAADADNGCSSSITPVSLFINKAIANAGRDTIVVKNIPFQLHGQGGAQYSWSPSLGMDNPNIATPTVTLQDDIQYTLTVTTAEGCMDDDDINITVFKGSAVYVPSGFTPNGDGLNETLKPALYGIKSLEFFQVYNRWGQLLFNTKTIGKGWDARAGGIDQPAGVYIWMLQATDYVGKVYQYKGTTTLIR